MKKKVLSLLLVLVMLVSLMPIVASACDPSLKIEKTVTSKEGHYTVGEVITYKVKLTNTGDEDLTNIIVTDAKDSSSPRAVRNLDEKRQVGQGQNRRWEYDSVEYSYTYTVTAADVTAGKVTNTASATSKYRYNDRTYTLPTVSDSCEVATYEPANPHITVEKTSNTTEGLVGYNINYDVTITNDGNVPVVLTGVSDSLVYIHFDSQTLNAGSSLIVRYEYTPTEVGDLVNTVTVTGTYNDTTLTETDTLTIPVERVGISVVKTVNVASALSGSEVEWKIVVTNTGTVTLTDISVNDIMHNSIPNIVSLPAGESSTIQYWSRINSDSDSMSESAVNTVEVVGHYGDITVTDNSSASVDFITEGTITVNKTIEKSKTESVPGEGFEFKLYTFRNDVRVLAPSETSMLPVEWDLVDTKTTNSAGVAEFTSVPFGYYYKLVETPRTGYTNNMPVDGDIFIFDKTNVLYRGYSENGTAPVINVVNYPVASETPTPSNPPRVVTEKVNLTVTVEGPGSVLPSSGSYSINSLVVMTVTPNAGAEFIGWFGPNGSEVTADRITMNSDKNIIARFAVPETIEVVPTPVPEAPPVVLEPLPIPEPEPEPEPEVIIDEPTPEAPPVLPKTGGMPIGALVTAGLGLLGAGFKFRKK